MLASSTGRQTSLLIRGRSGKLSLRTDTTTSSEVKSASTEKPPLRQGSAYYSTKNWQDYISEADPEGQARQQTRSRARISELRGRILRTRHTRMLLRQKLHRLREDVRFALDKFTRKVNESVALGSHPANIGAYSEELRNAQDALGPAEQEYDDVERQLDADEWNLEQEEETFYRHIDLFSFLVPETKFEEELSPLVKPNKPPDTDVHDFNFEDDLVQVYLTKVEEANEVREELEELEEDYCQRKAHTSFRNRLGIPLSKETVKFLNDFPRLRGSLLDSLQEVETALFDLRSRCIEQHLFAECEHVYKPHDMLYKDIMELIDEIRDRSPLCVASRRFEYPKHARDFGDKRDYVNTWLLHRVQDSPVDRLMLKDFIYMEYPDSSDKPKDLDNHGWSELAVENWDIDTTGAMASEYFHASRLDAIAGDTNRPTYTSSGHAGHSGISSGLRSLEADLDDDAMFDGSIMESETGSYASHAPEVENSLGHLNTLPADIPLASRSSWSITPRTKITPKYKGKNYNVVVDKQLPISNLDSSFPAGPGIVYGAMKIRRHASF